MTADKPKSDNSGLAYVRLSCLGYCLTLSCAVSLFVRFLVAFVNQIEQGLLRIHSLSYEILLGL